MTIGIQRRQLDIWIDLEMISLLGGQELLNTEICWKSRCSFFFLNSVKEGEERRSSVRYVKGRQGKAARLRPRPGQRKCEKECEKRKVKKDEKKENNVKKVKKMWKSAKKKASETLIPIDWLKSAIPISLSPQFLSTRPAPVPSSDRKKKKCHPHSTFSVS